MGFFKDDKKKDELSENIPKVEKNVTMMQEVTLKTVLGKSVQVKGNITAEEEILIEGKVEGEIRSSKKIIIGTQGDAKANLYAPIIKVAGKVTGDLIATMKIEIESTAHIEGNIKAPKLSVSESAYFKGNIDMSGKPEIQTEITEKSLNEPGTFHKKEEHKKASK